MDECGFEKMTLHSLVTALLVASGLLFPTPQAVQNMPTDIYSLAKADLEAEPINPAGFWLVVKAAQAEKVTEKKQMILEYGRKKYVHYHGGEQGWNDLVNDAERSSSVMPPAGFTVAAAPPPPSPAEQAADLVKTKDPKQMSFAEWELVLSSGNQQAADTVWNAIKDKAVKLQASVISATATSVKLAGSDDDIEAKKADIDLTMAKALPARLVPQVGALMIFQGTFASYTLNPFMMTMTDGVPSHRETEPHANYFQNLLDANAFPKWANTVCIPEYDDGVDAGMFTVLGPKGTVMQARTYLDGIAKKDYIYDQRRTLGADTLLASRPWESLDRGGWWYSEIKVNWDTGVFTSEWRSVNSGQTDFRQHGHCKAFHRR